MLREEVKNVCALNCSLQKSVSELKVRIEGAERIFDNRLEEMETYSRRQCLRIEGIPVKEYKKNASVMQTVQSCFDEAGLTIPNDVVDRAHRVGPVYKNKDDSTCQPIIVKYNNFRYRTDFYRKRKSLKGKRVRIDLTKKRYDLLKRSMNFINDGSLTKKLQSVYVFADINCRLKIVDTESETECFIDSFEDFENFISKS